MKDKIYKRAKDFTCKALKDYVEGEKEHFLVNLAISAELLGKAFLAGIHPSLIVDKDFDSLLHVCGAGQHSNKSPANIRTIGAREVFNRCSQILPKLKEHEHALNTLANIRSGLIHLGEHDDELSKNLFTPYLKYVKIVLEALKISFSDHFEEYSDVADTNIKDSKKESEVLAQSALAKARSNYRERFEDVEGVTKKNIIETIKKSYVVEKYDQELVNCPACSNTAVMSGSHAVDGWEADFDRDGIPEGAYPVVKLYGDSLKCNICGLEIESATGLEAAGIETPLLLENVDPVDFYEELNDPYF
ncbi:hypothetical protein ACFL42_02145 [Candidatus Omnitrophota bacterium]